MAYKRLDSLRPSTRQKWMAIKDYHEQLHNGGMRWDWALTKTAKHFYISEDWTQRIMTYVDTLREREASAKTKHTS